MPGLLTRARRRARAPGDWITLSLLAVAALLGARWLLVASGAYHLAAIAGDTLAPAVPAGSLALAESVLAERVRSGDIILFPDAHKAGRRIPLRVVDAEPAGSLGTGASGATPGGAGRLVRLAGDAPDFGIPWEAEMHGRVVRVVWTVPRLGWVAERPM